MKCKICDNTINNQIYEVSEMMLGYRDLFFYFQCSLCNCLQIKEIPENMSKYYPENYYSYSTEKSGNRLKNHIIKLRDKYALCENNILGKLIYLVIGQSQLEGVGGQNQMLEFVIQRGVE